MQFGKPIAEFGLIKQKVGHMVVETATPPKSAVNMVAALIDAGHEDYAVEAAISKVFASEALWRTADEALQIAGGNGYMCEYPYERVAARRRINRIFEGTNDILRLFIALTAMNDVGRPAQGARGEPQGRLQRSDQGLRRAERVRAPPRVAGHRHRAGTGNVHPAQPGAEAGGRGVRGAHPGTGHGRRPHSAQARQAHHRQAVRHSATGGHHDRSVRDGLRAVAGGLVGAPARREAARPGSWRSSASSPARCDVG